MPSAPGYIRCFAGGHFVSSFLVDVHGFTFTGSLGSNVPAFSCHASIIYTALNQLEGTRSFTGHIGVNDIKIVVSNRLVIEGVLDTPIDPRIHVSGSGVWTSN
ncbi:hypothetical protein B0H34DRAFT_691156 [Crassisporium funariophilum]|nr:hypothetical protein B0H34DRAFT_691156 [Crassisporium funariophilum]